MESCSKKQSTSWSILSKQVDMFAKKTNLEVAVVTTFIDRLTGQRKTLVHGTEVLQQSIHDNVDRIVTLDIRPPSLPSMPPPQPPNSPTSPASIELPDMRKTVAGSLSKAGFAHLRKLLPVLVVNTVEGRSQPLWGRADKAPCWWPSSIPFANPTTKPKEVPDGQWVSLLRKAARACYTRYNMSELTGDATEEFRSSQEDLTYDQIHSVSNSADNSEGFVEDVALGSNNTYTIPPQDSITNMTINTDQSIPLTADLTTINPADITEYNVQSTPNTSRAEPVSLSMSFIPDPQENQTTVGGARKRGSETRTSKRKKKRSEKSRQHEITKIEKLMALKRSGELDEYVRTCQPTPLRRMTSPADMLLFKYQQPQQHEKYCAVLDLDEESVNFIIQFLVSNCSILRDSSNLAKLEDTLQWVVDNM